MGYGKRFYIQAWSLTVLNRTEVMDDDQAYILRRRLFPQTVEQLLSLWQQLAEKVGSDAVFMTEEALLEPASDLEVNSAKEYCRLLLSPEFKVLLVGKPNFDHPSYQVSMTWDEKAIAQFIKQLPPAQRSLLSARDRRQQPRFPQASTAQDLINYLTLKLLEILTPEDPEILAGNYSSFAVCKPVEDALHQQVAQERLLNQVIAQIRQSLDLSVILEIAVREVRNFLQVDRLVIYQFGQQSSANSHPEKKQLGWGRIAYEAIASEQIPSILNLVVEEECFTYIPHYQDKYTGGRVVAVEDVFTAYSSSFCLAEFLSKCQIRAKLIAPIIVQGKLWGLLIAHQCFQPRQWLDYEKNFLRHIGEHLAIAIYQAQLYAQVQQQKESFEQRVIERTKELRDTLIAVQAANQSKSEFLGNVSHELRTPLTCVIGLSGTLLHWSDRGAALPLEKQRQYLQTIQESGKHLLDLINDIIDFSDLEAGKSLLKIREFSLQVLSRKIIDYLQEDATRQTLTLELDFRVDAADDHFWADSDRVQQILYHLLSNAIKFTPAGGSIILRVWRENNYAVFQVEDTGIGISEHQLPLLFTKFQQLEKSRERTYGGTGLGLALTKQLVELHRGTIEVESLLAQGSIFTVWLPNQPQQRQPRSQTTSAPASTSLPSGKTIVLVENDEEIATLICELLTAANYQVVWLIDGSTSIKQIELLQPAVVILDRQMPDVYHISQTLKKRTTTRAIKILILRDSTTSFNQQNLAQKGVDVYLFKPIQPNLLLQMIGALIMNEGSE